MSHFCPLGEEVCGGYTFEDKVWCHRQAQNTYNDDPDRTECPLMKPGRRQMGLAVQTGPAVEESPRS